MQWKGSRCLEQIKTAANLTGLAENVVKVIIDSFYITKYYTTVQYLNCYSPWSGFIIHL